MNRARQADQADRTVMLTLRNAVDQTRKVAVEVPAGSTVRDAAIAAEIVQGESFDVFTAQCKEASVATVFRYAYVYHRAVALIASGKIDVKPLITDTFDFADAPRAFEWALDMPETV